jgi:hypothetical protein
MSDLLNNLPNEVSYIREYALQYARDTKEETSNLINKLATKKELNDLAELDSRILENEHLDILLEFVEDNLQDSPEEAKRLNSFIWAIMAVPGS